MYTGLTAKMAHAGLSNGLKADGNRKMTTGAHLVHDQAITISADASCVYHDTTCSGSVVPGSGVGFIWQ